MPGVDARKARVRPLDVADLKACLDLAEDRSWAREEVKWRFLLELGGGYGVDDPNGGLVGTVFLTRVAPGIGAVGMLLVARRHAGHGLGRRLMEEALSVAGRATVFLYATEEGRPLYEKLGFRVVDEVTTYTGVFRRSAGQSPATRVRAAEAEDLSVLARVDLHSDAAEALGGWLSERGLTARRPVPLMVLGNRMPGNRALMLSPLMQALG